MREIYEQDSPRLATAGGFANKQRSNFLENTDSERAGMPGFIGVASHLNYVPPPSAPQKLRNQNDKKLFTTL